MASNPPQFQVDDQTDEDFFDNLVKEEDDFGGPAKTAAAAASTSVSDVNGRIAVDSNDSDSDDAKAFANLSIDDSGNDSKKDIGTESIAENNNESNGWDQSIRTELDMYNGSDLNSGSLLGTNNESDVKDLFGFRDGMDSVAGKNCGSVAKEVEWGSFYADSTEQIGNHHGFGSYSDFFSDLGENSAELPGKIEGDVNGEAKILSRNEEFKAGAMRENSVDYGTYSQHRESQGYGAEENANGHDLNCAAYWESMYPGWKYDANTGQLYQVDAIANIQQGSSDVASGGDWNVVSEKSEFSYLNQSYHYQSVVGTVAETTMTKSVSNWNGQTSPVDNNGYPDHMIFDPQYPGWYYDAIAQEWRALESYNSSEQSTVQAHDQLSQNADMYLNNSNGIYSEFGQADTYGSQVDEIQSLHDKRTDNYGSQGLGNLNQSGSWTESYGNYSQQGLNMRQHESGAKAMSVPNFGQNQQVDNICGSKVSVDNHVDQQNSFSSMRSVPSYNRVSQGHGGEANGFAGFQSLVPNGDFSQQFNQAYMKQDEQLQHSNDFYGSQKQVMLPQQSFLSDYQNSYTPNIRRSSAGRPPHALVTFGFGGKLIVMKDHGSLQNSTFGSQGHVEGSISVLNLMEVFRGNSDASSPGAGAYDYFHALCQQSFPGPLVGGSVGSKELNKWIDEKIAICESPDMNYRNGEVLKLLLSLLKIACQHYGKFRSPFGTDTTESETPESAVAKLFASVKKNGSQYAALNHCLQNLPSEGQIRATASEVQNLLVSGQKKEALLCAQEGQLWGPALILASQLGEQFYVDTVKQMALRQLVAGSPLRTLCLLIAGQPADVFYTEVPAVNGFPGAVTVSQQSTNFGDNRLLDDWEENLALITANRTKHDELVIIHLGDCLWKDRNEITAAHICYLVAEANFESYSDSARLCLIGADHWKCPRTYASPEAIQRTELYEYSKVLGNSQFSLLPFQPYKLIYAYMLAEVGKVSDSLKYCQALSKSLKNGRAPEVETWKQLVLSLEERIKIHQQGGYTANLAPAKLVGKLLNFFDSTAHRVVGGLPPPAPSLSQGTVQSNGQDHQLMGNIVSASQSTMAMSSLMPSASMEPISEWAANGNQMTISNRSVSEPDFGRTPRQVDSSMEATSSSAEGKAPLSGGTSRFSRFGFGSGLLQKTVGLVLKPREDKQAKLGEKNKFYYDEKLKRWVEEGAEPPTEEPALAPPPTTTAFQNGTSDYNLQSALKIEGSPSSGNSKFTSPTTSEHSSGIPPIPTSTNQFSARGRMGVRARYVDTFNQGKASPAKSFQSPSVPSVKPAVAANAKFFVPASAPPAEQPMEAVAENVPEDSATNEKPNDSFQSPTSSSTTGQRFQSTENIPSEFIENGNGSLPSHSRGMASWNGSFPNGSIPNLTETRPPWEAIGVSPPSSFMPSRMNGGSFGDELHEVEL